MAIAAPPRPAPPAGGGRPRRRAGAGAQPAGRPPSAPASAGMLFLPGPLRLLTFALFALLVARRWQQLADPRLDHALLRATGLAVALAVLLLVLPAGGRHRRGRRAAGILLTLVVLAAALLAAGVPLRLLAPRRWDDLASGIGSGLSALPALRVPYRGEQPWIRTTVALGGTLLLVLSAAVGFAGRGRPVAAAAILLGAYTVAVTQVEQRHALGDGALLTLLLAFLLLGERVRAAQAQVAGGALVAALAIGAVAVHRLDASGPWIDYRALAGELGSGPLDHFSWTQSYAALPWSRDGRQVLRIRAPRAEYWKGVSLDAFDGVRWRRAARPLAVTAPAARMAHPRWVHEVAVDVRDMSSAELFAPGEVLSVSHTSVATRPGTPGTVRTSDRPAARGDSYVARVYNPDPTAQQRAQAGAAYPAATQAARTLGLPAPGGLAAASGAAAPPTVPVRFPAFGTAGPPVLVTPAGRPLGDATGLVGASVYARAWALAQRLRAASSSPDDLVQRVQARLRAVATYDERPPAARVPLEAFLFGSRRGYCQQFSGAMALLLRMAGVPARVAEGFAPGSYDAAAKRYVVHDSDAHAWVEVYYPRIGWTVVDPTPAIAPPASQFDTAVTADAAPKAGTGPAPGAGDRAAGTPASTPAAGGSGGGGGPSAAVVAATAGLAVLLVALWARGRRRRARSSVPLELRELVRALGRVGAPVPAATTLAGLERSALAAAPGAHAYLRALARARYAVPGAPAPPGVDREARRGLRRSLAAAAGGGPRGRLRAWWALPPGLPGHGRERNGHGRRPS